MDGLQVLAGGQDTAETGAVILVCRIIALAIPPSGHAN